MYLEIPGTVTLTFFWIRRISAKLKEKFTNPFQFDFAIVTGELVCLCLTPVFQGISKTHALN